MIERYTLPEMGRVWSDQHKYELWCRVETLVLEAHAAAGRVPADVVEPVRNAPAAHARSGSRRSRRRRSTTSSPSSPPGPTTPSRARPPPTCTTA